MHIMNEEKHITLSPIANENENKNVDEKFKREINKKQKKLYNDNK